MSETNKNRPHWVYVTLVGSAIIAVAILAVTVFYMKRQLDAVNRTMAVAMQQTSPSPPATPSTSSQDAIAPDDKWRASPFDADEWTPFFEMSRMRDQINRMFHDAFSHFNQSPDYKALTRGIAFTPEIDVLDDADEVTIKVDLPGVKAADVDVEVEGQTAIISGERVASDKKTGPDGKVVKRERRVGRFSRVIELPAPVVADKMVAKCEAGTYTVTLPKAS